MILLTGGSGFLGNAILSKLARRNLAVRCIYRKKRGPAYLGVTWVKIDSLTSIPQDLLDGCTYIIHCAGKIKGSGAVLNSVNYVATKRLVQAALEKQIKKFVFISSIDSVLLDSAYAKSKMLAEESLIESGINWVIIRPSVIFGLDDNKNFYLLNKLIKALPVIPVPYSGKFRWDPVYVEDLADYTINAALDDGISEKAFNVIGPETLKFNEILRILQNYNRVKKPLLLISSLMMNFSKGILTLFLGKHRCDEIFSAFSDKIIGDEAQGKKVRLTTKLADIYKSAGSN